ncbi:hypothetical protein ACMD2_14303, partial [Ananas comosus]
TYNLVKFESF